MPNGLYVGGGLECVRVDFSDIATGGVGQGSALARSASPEDWA